VRSIILFLSFKQSDKMPTPAELQRDFERAAKKAEEAARDAKKAAERAADAAKKLR
jgi:hypothetical protein